MPTLSVLSLALPWVGSSGFDSAALLLVVGGHRGLASHCVGSCDAMSRLGSFFLAMIVWLERSVGSGVVVWWIGSRLW